MRINVELSFHAAEKRRQVILGTIVAGGAAEPVA